MIKRYNYNLLTLKEFADAVDKPIKTIEAMLGKELRPSEYENPKSIFKKALFAFPADRNKRKERELNSHRLWTDEDKFMLADMFRQGHSIEEIAVTLDRSVSAIQNRIYLKKTGVIIDD